MFKEFITMVKWTKLPAERRGGQVVAASIGCCCCCCCAHSAGGLLGALVALGPRELNAEKDCEPVRVSANAVYWSVLLLFTLVVGVGGFVAEGDMETALWYIAFSGPVIQLVVSVFVALGFIIKRPPHYKERLKHLAKITGLSIIGATLGVLLMWSYLK